MRASKVVTYSSIAAVKADIQANGPVETYMAAYQDLYYYKSGIYAPTTNQKVGYHAVKVIGFGVENGVNYWLVQNSWGTSWGMSGFFKIKAGTCEFDDIDHFVSGTV
jgi:cathepsin B